MHAIARIELADYYERVYTAYHVQWKRKKEGNRTISVELHRAIEQDSQLALEGDLATNVQKCLGRFPVGHGMPPFICATLSSRTSQLIYGPTKITPAPSCDGEYKCVPQPDSTSTPPLPNTQAHTHIQTQIFTLPPARPPTFQRVERSALVRLEANIRNSLLLYRRG